MACGMRGQGFERWAAAAVFAAVLAAGAALRLWQLMGQPFWLDEAYSAYAADHGFRFLWTVVPRYETHPPVYYSLVRLWSLGFGETLAARRWLGLACGLAAIPATALAAAMFGRLLDRDVVQRRWLAVVAATLAAVHPHMVLMARQVRPYPVMTLVYALGLAAVLWLGCDARDGRRLDRRWLTGFTLAEVAMLWLHTLGPLFGASLALALALLTLRRGMARGDLVALAASQVAAALVYLPALAIAAMQAPTWVGTTWLVFRPGGIESDLGLLWATWNRGVMALAGAAMLVAIVMAVRARWGLRTVAALLVAAVLPVSASIALSVAVSPVFLTRTLAAVTVPALVLTAAGLVWPGRGRVIGLGLAALLAAAYAYTAWGLVERRPPQDWYGTVAWLQTRMRPGDVVWAYPNEGALPLDYALRDRHVAMPVVPIPGAVPAFGLGGHFVTGSQGVVSLDAREIDALVARAAAVTPPTIWVLRLGPWKYDPGDALIHALGRRRVEVDHMRRGAIDLTGMRRIDATARRAAPAGAAAAR